MNSIEGMRSKIRANRESPRVLLVDDDITIRFLCRQTLEREGFVVEEAENGMQALIACEKISPNIILLDVMMPEMDGFTTCVKIRSMPGEQFTPILMMTGLDDFESINQAFEVGATDFITKPCNWLLLAHRIRYLLRSSDAFKHLKESEKKNHALLQAIPDVLCQIDRKGTFIEISGKKNINWSMCIDELLGKNISQVIPSDLAQLFIHYIDRTLQNKELQLFEYKQSIDGREHYFEARFVPNKDNIVLAIIRDITEQKEAEGQLIHLAYHDKLTNLPNRLFFADRLEEAISNSERKNQLVAILLLDLDNFKNINDTLGHNIGDKLLQDVTDRLSNAVRKTDLLSRISEQDLEPVLAHLGGDEFTFLVSHINEVQDVARIAERLLGLLSSPFIIESHELFVTASIGITVFPFDGKDVEKMMKNADLAMYQAKKQGRNNYQFYTESMNKSTMQRFNIEKKLRKALENQEFQLFYQPQIDISTKKVIGVEALIRWLQPDLILVKPDEFIPLAEETGLIVPIGEWILHAACGQNKAWQTDGLDPLIMTINVSSIQFKQKNFVEMVAKGLIDTGLEPKYLQLELTESTVMENDEDTMKKLLLLENIGVKVSIDDFGTGYSSLNYLKNFPISTLKIDRSFIKDLVVNISDQTLTKAIIGLAHNFNLQVIAEGVETQKQLHFLHKHKCDAIQGYLICPALNSYAIKSFLEKKYILHISDEAKDEKI